MVKKQKTDGHARRDQLRCVMKLVNLWLRRAREPCLKTTRGNNASTCRGALFVGIHSRFCNLQKGNGTGGNEEQSAEAGGGSGVGAGRAGGDGDDGRAGVGAAGDNGDADGGVGAGVDGLAGAGGADGGGLVDGLGDDGDGGVLGGRRRRGGSRLGSGRLETTGDLVGGSAGGEVQALRAADGVGLVVVGAVVTSIARVCKFVSQYVLSFGVAKTTSSLASTDLGANTYYRSRPGSKTAWRRG